MTEEDAAGQQCSRQGQLRVRQGSVTALLEMAPPPQCSCGCHLPKPPGAAGPIGDVPAGPDQCHCEGTSPASPRSRVTVIKKMNFYLSSLFLLGLFHPVMTLSRRDATGMEPHWWQGHAGWGWKLMAAGCLNDFGNQGRGGWHSVGFGTACSLACSPVWHSS